MSRNLLNRSFEVLGVDQKIWIALEAGGYGVAATTDVPGVADAVEHINAGIKFNIPREDSTARSGRSVVTRLSGKKTVDMSLEGYIIPGTPDLSNHPTLPPLHPLFLSAFGKVDLTDPEKIAYKLSRLNSASFRMLEEATHYSRLAVGCVMDKLTFSLPGDGKAQVKAEGFAQDVFCGGESTLAVDPDAGNDLTVATGTGQMFEVGAYVDVIDKDDGSTVKVAKRKILAVVGDVLTVNGAALPSCDIGDIIIGHAPDTFDAISSANALLGLKGSFTAAGYPVGQCEFISAEISIANNFTQKNFLYGTSRICGYLPDKRRTIGVKLEMLLNKSNYAFYMRNKQFIAEDITITLEPQDIPAPMLTSSLGRTFEFKMPRVEFNIPPIEQPGDKYVTLTLEGTALAPDMNHLDEELTLTIR